MINKISSDRKNCVRAEVIKTVWLWPKERDNNQWNRTEGPGEALAPSFLS